MSDTDPLPPEGGHSGRGDTDLGPALELLGQTVGGYEIESLLGVGGMGLVYQAKHPVLARRFAVKVLRPEAAEDKAVAANFIREAQTLSQLKHPHIIDIVGFGEHEQRQFMVMEFLEGKTVHEELEETGALTPVRALELADHILDALDAAHSVEVIHRDLKPRNVFLARVSGGREVVKLLDFGLAKQQPVELADGAGSDAGKSVVAGTPEYIAPEQATGQRARKQSDLYSFGVMLYELLTGRQPFELDPDAADPVIELLKAHLHQAPPKLSKHSMMTFPEELEDVIADLLQKDPDSRPSGAGVVRARLQKVARALQQESTREGPNVLLQAPAPQAPAPEAKPAAPLTLKIERQPSTDVEMAAIEPPPPAKPKWPIAAAVVAVLVIGLVGWFARPKPQVPAAIEVAAPPAPVVAAEPSPVVPAAPAPVALQRADPPGPAKAQPPAKTMAAIATPAPAKGKRMHIEIRATECEASDRWRAAARTHLEELQQVAAASNDKNAWKTFEAAEPGLTSGITKASNGVDCEEVEVKIKKLAGVLKRLSH